MKYSAERMTLAARSFRNLADTYSELANKGGTNIEYKTAIMMQLTEMAQMLEKYSGEGASFLELSKGSQKSILRGLKSHGVIVETISFIKRDEKHEEIAICAYAMKGCCVTVNEVAKYLSEALEARYVPVDNVRIVVNKERAEYYFQKAPRFESICKVTNRCKGENTVCGDAFSCVKLAGGQEIICIVDGMGSGILANRDSRIVIELLEQFLEAGFSEMAAIRMINTAFSVNDYVGNPIALDMCVMDKYLGVCNFIKLGAVATFIKRKGWVEVIKSTTLPMGVFENVDFDNTVKKLYDGDFIIMVSDGIIDSFEGDNKEEQLIEIIAGATQKNPEGLSEYILQSALKNTKDVAIDDMTVAVTLISAVD